MEIKGSALGNAFVGMVFNEKSLRLRGYRILTTSSSS